MQVTQLKVPRFVLEAASESKPPDHATYARAINCAVHPTYTLHPTPLTLNRPRLEAQASECRVEVAGIRLQAAACSVQVSGNRIQGTGYRAAPESKPPDHATYARAINCAVLTPFTQHPTP